VKYPFKDNVRTPSVARWKARGRLSSRHDWLFLLSLTVETLWAKICRVGVFRRGWVTFGEYVTEKGASPTNQCWCQKTRVIAVSCGFRIFAVHHSVLSQYTHLADGRTDRQNCDSNFMRCIACRTV